jgi:sigma-B regulation protein RsbU (phosphoserine phosphatase)
MSNAENARKSDTATSEEDDKRRLVAHLRHEMRTALAAVIGYSEDLLETLRPGTPASIEQDLRALRGAGAAVLSAVDDRLGAEAIRNRMGDALPALIRELAAACSEPSAAIASLSQRVLSQAEREGLYDIIPTVCRIQAAGVMLTGLLDGYERGPQPVARHSSLPVDIGAGAEPEGVEPAELRGRVLIVDDNSITRDVLRRWLLRQGHEVFEASGGEEALALIRAHDYDLILLDLVMPDRSGLSVLETLGKEGRLGRAPIIMLSALDELSGVASCLERGADDYMTKPFHMVLLRARIRQSLELKRHRERERAYQAMLHELRQGETPR